MVPPIQPRRQRDRPPRRFRQDVDARITIGQTGNNGAGPFARANEQAGNMMLDSRSDKGSATAALALLSIIWGYNWVVMKLGLAGAGPFDFSALRFLLGAACLLPFMLARRDVIFPVGRQWAILLLLGVMLCANFGCVMSALKIGGAGKTAVLVYTMPFWVLVFARIALKEKLSRVQSIAVAGGAAGLTVLIEPWHLSGPLVASALAVIAGMSWGASVVIVKAIQGSSRPIPTMMVTFWQMVVAVPLLATIGWLFDPQPIVWSVPFALALGYVAVLATGLAWILFYYALRRMPAGMAGLGTLATPVIGVAAAWAQLGERPTATEAVGMLMIAVALALLALSSRKPPNTQAEKGPG
jgi:drug/metabolite transporter (DMT)-like permease